MPLRDAAFQHKWNKVLVGKELGLATINPGVPKYQSIKWPSGADTGVEANLRIFRSTAYYYVKPAKIGMLSDLNMYGGLSMAYSSHIGKKKNNGRPSRIR